VPIEEATVVYPAVDSQELKNIRQTGVFRPSPGGSEYKYFATTAKGAALYARLAYNAFGEGPFTLVEAQVPRSLIGDTIIVDGSIESVTIPNDNLPGFRPQIINYTPLP
jgi:hypothetical protein